MLFKGPQAVLATLHPALCQVPGDAHLISWPCAVLTSSNPTLCQVPGDAHLIRLPCAVLTSLCPALHQVPGARRCTFDRWPMTMCCSDVIMSSPVPGARRCTFDQLTMCCYDVIMSSPAPLLYIFLADQWPRSVLATPYSALCLEMPIWSADFWRHLIQPCV